jgi:hypothetical protein
MHGQDRCPTAITRRIAIMTMLMVVMRTIVMMILMVAIVMVIIVTVSPFTTAIIPEAAALLVLPPSVVDFRCHRMNPGTWSFPSLSPEFLNPG